MTLVDSNILLRAVHPEHPHHEVAIRSIGILRMRGEVLCIAPQNLVEFWAVATRPKVQNGLGLSITTAANEIRRLQDFFLVLPYAPAVVETWKRLVVESEVRGKQTHDAHLVALMVVQSVTNILTFNGPDFQRFSDIRVIEPGDLQTG